MIRSLSTVHYDGTVLSGYLCSYYEAYGAEQPFLRFYGNDDGGQIAVMDGVATVCGCDTNREELLWFLQSQPDIIGVRAYPSTAAYLAKKWQAALTVRPIMKCNRPVETSGEMASPSPRLLHPFLASIFPEMPPFEPWYLDVCYRLRHGFCHIAAVESAGVPVSSAMTVAEWSNGAMLGAVATAAEHRRKGYAARCVTTLTARLQTVGKDVYICPKTENAKELYEQLGFTVCGEMAMVERK